MEMNMAKNLNLNLDLKKLDLKQLGGLLKNIDLASLKKYSGLFPSIGLLLASIVILIVTLLIGGSVGKKMGQSVQASRDISSKISQTPSEAEAVEAEKYYQKYVEDADKVDAMAVQASLRDLICYNPVIFPKPVDKSTQVYSRYGSQYRLAIEKLIERIGAKDSPGNAEIQSQIGRTTAPGGDYMQPAATGGPQNARIDAICLQRADEIPVYANPDIFPWYGFWEKYTYKSQDQAMQDCWYSQVAYWIYEDVIATVKDLNADSAKVPESPVKRLLGVRFNGPVQVIPSSMSGGVEGMGVRGLRGVESTAMGGLQQQDNPIYVKGPSVFMPVPWTGRMSNTEIDVIHFAVSAVVDSKSVTAFMKQLCLEKPHVYREKFEEGGKEGTAVHNQITILQFHIEPVVRDRAVHAYYRYGKDAVVQVNLICEYIFNRQAYDVIKPDIIKGISQDQNTGTFPNPSGQGM